MKHIYRNLTAVLAGACVLSAAFCLPALAAEGWQQEAGMWTYVDSKGEQPTGQWKKIDNRWYYFEDDGRMAQDAWIDDSYVGEDGVRQESVWIKEASPDGPAEKWYYLKKDGRKAVEDDGWQKIGDSSYLFDADGRMKTGWQQWKEDVYYLGTDGRRVTGWRYLKLNFTEEDQFMHEDCGSEEEGWFWFSSSGVCCRGKNIKDINGQKYCFDQNGRMMSGWVLDGAWEMMTGTASNAKISSYTYYGDSENGARVNGWIRGESPEGEEGEQSFYEYYLKSGRVCSVFNPDGTLRNRGLRRIEATPDDTTGEGYAYAVLIEGKRYLFNHRGELLYGLKPVFGEGAVLIGSCMADPDSGEMKTGRGRVVESSGDAVEYCFDSSGNGVTGKKGGRIYYLGRIQAAEEKYRLISLPDDMNSSDNSGYTTYLVDKQGKVQEKTGRMYQTENAGDVILFSNPKGSGLSLYQWRNSRNKSDYGSADLLAEDMKDCSEYMESLTEPGWK